MSTTVNNVSFYYLDIPMFMNLPLLIKFKYLPKMDARCINFLGMQPTFTQVPPNPGEKKNNPHAKSASQT